MLREAAELAARIANLRAILFTEVTSIGLLLAAGLAVASTRLSGEARERLVIAVSLAIVVWIAGPAVALVLGVWSVGFVAVVELGGVMGGAVAVGLLAVL